MDAELKHKWVGALRSGAFSQGRYVLLQFRGGGPGLYCCMGVLCDIDERVRWNPYDEIPQVFQAVHNDGDRTYTSHKYLPERYKKLIGLDPAKEDRLAKMNDSGKSFAEIADYIEAEL